MNKLKFYIALIVARLIYFVFKVTKLSSGTAIIGLIALKICPEFLFYANNYVKKSKINITGTNGKTTTSAVIAHVLKKADNDILYNSTGANMLNGIVNSMALQINLFKQKDYSVIECDEGFLGKVFEKYNSDYLVVTNIFDDQLDRYGSADGTKKLIQQAIDKMPELQLLLNADDPFIANFKPLNKEPIYYGVENIRYEDGLENSLNLQNTQYQCDCGQVLEYSKYFYSKIGHYSCSNCGYKRAQPKYLANITVYKNYCTLDINGIVYNAPVMGVFNAYNVLAAISLLLEIGITPEIIQKNLTDYKVFSGRCEYKLLNGHKTLIQLIKNPVGATEVLKTVDLNSNIFIAINDNAADGRDFSWINSAEFEILKNAKKEIVVSGIRAKEMAERLEKAGCEKIKVISDLDKAVDYIGKTADNNITMLPNYTVLQKLDKMKSIRKG